MAKGKQNTNGEGIQDAYAAIVDYHNNLVQLRFTIVGLYLATNVVLATGFVQPGSIILSLPILQVAGILLAGFCWLIEVRNFQLMENLGERGLKLEAELGLDDNHGFFSLMENQPIDPRLLPTRLRISAKKFFSHATWISLLYTLGGITWLALAVLWVLEKCKTA